MLGNDAFWVPTRIWAVAAEQRPDGIFQDVTPEQFAMLIGYVGDAPSMVQALLQAGFMDSDPFRIHNWDRYNGYHVAYAERASKAAKARWNKRGEEKNKRRIREETSNAQALLQASRGFNAPNIEEIASFAQESGKDNRHVEPFFNYYESNGWRVGKNVMKKWKSAFLGWVDRNEKGVYSKNGSTEKSIFELELKKKAKQTKCDELKRKYAHESPLGDEWSDLEKRREHGQLKKEISAINDQISRS